MRGGGRWSGRRLLRDGSSETPVAPPEPTAVAGHRPAREKAEEREPSPPRRRTFRGKDDQDAAEASPDAASDQRVGQDSRSSQQPPRPPLPPQPAASSQPRNVRVGAPPGFPGGARRSPAPGRRCRALNARFNVDRLGGTQWADAKAEMSEQETRGEHAEGLTSVDSPNPTVHGRRRRAGGRRRRRRRRLGRIIVVVGQLGNDSAASPLTSPTRATRRSAGRRSGDARTREEGEDVVRENGED